MSPRSAKAVRGRHHEDPSAALRELLITTAERLLVEGQVADITTRDIARAAGVSIGVIYNYFASKNDLLVTALVRRVQRGVAQFDDNLPEPGTATVEENLNRFARAMFDLHASALPTIAGLMTDPPLLHQFIAELHRPPFGAQLYPQRVTEYLDAEQRLGRLSSVNLEAATTLLVGATAMLALSGLLRGGSPDDGAGLLPDIVDTLICGLDQPPSSEQATTPE